MFAPSGVVTGPSGEPFRVLNGTFNFKGETVKVTTKGTATIYRPKKK